MDGRPVGVFDSGMGGLTVLHELLVTLPHEDFVYLGDGARLPYGPRPPNAIQRSGARYCVSIATAPVENSHIRQCRVTSAAQRV